MDRHFTLSDRTMTYTATGDRTVSIGQSEGCDIRIENHTQYADEIFAKIAPDRDSDGWHLIKYPSHWPIFVNGTEVNRVHYLRDKDVIEMPGRSLRFNILEGMQKEPAIVHVHTNKGLIWSLVAAVTAIAIVVGYRIIYSARDNISETMQNDIEASLFTLRVDSLQLLCNDTVADSYVYASTPTGTAFLTTDSLLVTARHCLEPWLNQVLPFQYSDIPSMTDWPVSTALFAETENQFSGKEIYRIKTFITLTDENGNSFPLTSDRFHIDRDLDEIVDVGSYDSALYWRSISHRYSRQSMMLGDIATAHLDRPGLIPIADSDDLRRLLSRKGAKLTFFGHPESAVSGNSLDRQTDELRNPLSESVDIPGRIFMLSHGGDLTPGFSGGPAIVRDGLGFKAVGVISVIDEKNNTRSYSVPTSEIKK